MAQLHSVCTLNKADLRSIGLNHDLQRSYRIVLSINGNAPMTCPVVTAQNPLWINAFGACQPNEGDVVCCLNPENELVIEKKSNADVMILRFGRQYHLKPGKAILLFKNDIITIESSNIEITKLTEILSQPNHSYNAYWRILSTIAAVFTLCNVHSVANGQTPDSTSCQEGYTLCIDNNAYECVNHRWKLIEECQKPAQCYNGNPKPRCSITKWYPTPQPEKAFCKYSEPCTNGHYMCYGHHEIYQCKDNKWIFNKECSGGLFCQLESETEAKCIEHPCPRGKPAIFSECDREQMKCDSETAIMICDLGKWRYKRICKEPKVCKQITDWKAECVMPEASKPFWFEYFQDIPILSRVYATNDKE